MRVDWKRVSVYLLFALAVSCLVLGYVYTISQQRPGNVTYQKIQGDKSEHLTTTRAMTPRKPSPVGDITTKEE